MITQELHGLIYSVQRIMFFSVINVCIPMVENQYGSKLKIRRSNNALELRASNEAISFL